MITEKEAYDLFCSTLQWLDPQQLTLSDEVLGGLIFAELDTDATSFLHENNVQRLVNAGYVPKQQVESIAALRAAILALLNEEKTATAYRTHPEWATVRAQAMHILSAVILHQAGG